MILLTDHQYLVIKLSLDLHRKGRVCIFENVGGEIFKDALYILYIHLSGKFGELLGVDLQLKMILQIGLHLLQQLLKKQAAIG